MRKTTLIIISILFFGCANNRKWEPVKTIYNSGFSFEKGDILILKKKLTPYSLFGHSAIVLDKGRVAEYPAYGYGYIEVGISEWLEATLDRDMIILRPKLNDNQKEQIQNIVENYSYSKYGVINKKFGTSEFYCSSFIWRVYYDLGIDLDKNYKYFTMPYDFLKSPYLENKIEEN